MSDLTVSSSHPTSPYSMVGSLLRHRGLLCELVKRDFLGRYQGSMLGIAWSLFNPLLMLAIYTFVFSIAFNARWGTGDESNLSFATVLFSGMIVHGFFAECLNRAPGLITGNPNYVKKVVFPLEIMSLTTLLSALLHFCVSFAVLLVFCLLSGTTVHAGTLLVPVVLIPLILMSLGLSWMFASLGVYLRDLAQVVGMITTSALFLGPIFYPIEALPDSYQAVLKWNPITLPVLQLRDVMLWGKPVQWDLWLMSLAFGAVVCQIGYWWFQKSRRGFADVI